MRELIRNLVVQAIVDSDLLTEVVDKITSKCDPYERELERMIAEDVKERERLTADNLHTIQLTKPELHKCIMYLTTARRKSCSVHNHGILNSVLNKLKEAIK